MNIQEIANEHSREIIKNIFSKLDDEEIYVLLELNNQLQDNYLEEIYKGNVDLRLASLTLCKIDNIVNEALGDKENESR